MLEIISSILEAEKKADEIVKDATATSKDIKIKGNSEAENIVNSAVDDLKKLRTDLLLKAEYTAMEKYDKVIEDGKKSIEKDLEKSKKNLDKASDYIVKSILD